MKKFLSTLCAIALLATALCALASCGRVSKVDVDELLAKCNSHESVSVEETTFQSAPFAFIHVQTDGYRVYMHEVDGDDITVDYVNNDKHTVLVRTLIDDGIALVEVSESGEGRARNGFIVVGVPQKLMQGQSVLDVYVVTKTGAVQIEDVERAATLGVTVQKGTVYIEDCQADEVRVSSDTGAVYVEASGNSVVITTQKGAVGFDLDAKSITVTTDSGSVRGEVEADKSLYTIEVYTFKGKYNLSDSKGVDRFLTVKTQTGNIDVEFESDR